MIGNSFGENKLFTKASQINKKHVPITISAGINSLEFLFTNKEVMYGIISPIKEIPPALITLTQTKIDDNTIKIILHFFVGKPILLSCVSEKISINNFFLKTNTSITDAMNQGRIFFIISQFACLNEPSKLLLSWA